jgi:rRNA pseudouridine-1189 N-methylase Emg1 (Nep1/Mra1 family)
MISDHSTSTSSTSDDLPILDHYEIKHALLLLINDDILNRGKMMDVHTYTYAAVPLAVP